MHGPEHSVNVEPSTGFLADEFLRGDMGPLGMPEMDSVREPDGSCLNSQSEWQEHATWHAGSTWARIIWSKWA